MAQFLLSRQNCAIMVAQFNKQRHNGAIE